MTELISTMPSVDDDDDGYDSPQRTEDWNEECNQGAALLVHRRVSTKVMAELIQGKARCWTDAVGHCHQWTSVPAGAVDSV